MMAILIYLLLLTPYAIATTFEQAPPPPPFPSIFSPPPSDTSIFSPPPSDTPMLPPSDIPINTSPEPSPSDIPINTSPEPSPPSPSDIPINTSPEPSPPSPSDIPINTSPEPSPPSPSDIPINTSPEPSPPSPSDIPINTSSEPSPSDIPINTSPEPSLQSSDEPPITSDGKNGARHRVLVPLLAGLFVVIAILAMLAFFYRWMKKNHGYKEEERSFASEMSKEFEMGTGPRKFPYRELCRSTSHFVEENKLGEGGFGGVYKGFLKDSRTHIAVKRVSKSSKQGIKEYTSEVRIISRLRHKNLVQLIGWCHEKRELLLVYELMENGSLDSHLFNAKSLLTWETRYKIAHGLASALLYLHEEWEQCVLHRDIKSSNVMLDSNFNTKLGDFGLAKLVDHSKGSHTTKLAGTLGYMAPECIATGKASKESDVYSFGVVALEIACGRRPIDHFAPDTQINLVKWVWGLYNTKTLLEAVDPRLGADFHEEEIKRLMIVGLWCCHPDSQLRPSIKQAIQVLNSEVSLPILPSDMPVASYPEPSMPSLDGVSSIVEIQQSDSVTKYGH